EAQSHALHLDLEPLNPLPQLCDVLIERSNVVARSGSLHRGRAARAAELALPRQVLIDHSLDDLPAFLHPAEQLGPQVCQPSAQMRQLGDRRELLRSTREKI